MTDVRRHLNAALETEKEEEKNYHIRQALQLCDVGRDERRTVEERILVEE